MRVGFFPNLGKQNIGPMLSRVAWICRHAGMEVFLPAEQYDDGKFEPLVIDGTHVLPREELFATIDMAFSFGGDGTIIQLAKECLPHQIPICGINLGELGFLNQIELHNLQSRIHKIAQGDYFLEDRVLLAGYIEGPNGRKELPLALNDIVIMRKEPGKMARIILSIDGTETQQYPADGLIIATATGSTGYNMSAGGPIVAPTNHSLIVTPICPHLLQATPLILTENTQVGVTMPKREKALYISVDGTFDMEFSNDETLHIQAYDTYSQFVRFHDQGFFTVLFNKLNGRREMERS